MSTFIQGLGVGWAIGISPGAVLVLVIGQSLQFGLRAGMSVAVASLVATFPVVAVCYAFQLAIQNAIWMQRGLAFAGALFLLYSAYGVLTAPAIELRDDHTPAFAFNKGLLATLLNPMPYLFWTTVGIPLASDGHPDEALIRLVVFVAGFSITLFAVNAGLAGLVARFGRALPARGLNWVCRSTAVLLVGFAWVLVRRGVGW